MNCKYCGAPISPGATECELCGGKVENAQNAQNSQNIQNDANAQNQNFLKKKHQIKTMNLIFITIICRKTKR